MDRPTTARVRELMRLGNLVEATRVSEDYVRSLGNGTDSAPFWLLHVCKAQLLDAQGHTEDALKYLESLPAPDRSDGESRALLKMYRAAYAGYLGRYAISYQLFQEAEAIVRTAGLPETLGEIHLSRAFIFFRQKDYVASDRDFRSALNLSEQVGGWYLRGYGLWGIGKNLMIQELHGKAIPWFEKALAIFEAAEAQLAIAMVWSELAVSYLGLGKDEKALELFRKAERVNEDWGSVHNYQVVLANIGNVYLHRRDYFTAISYYQRALVIAREIKDQVSVRKWTRNVNLAYAKIRFVVDQTHPKSVGRENAMP